MTNRFTILIMDLMHRFISNQMIKCDDRDPSWITAKLKLAIKRKHQVYNKYVKKSCKQVRNETSAMITNSKDDCFAVLGRKLSKLISGKKSYWTTINKIINRKRGQTSLLYKKMNCSSGIFTLKLIYLRGRYSIDNRKF